jgi:hypothetical protein
MHRRSAVIAFAPALLAGYVLAAVPNHAAIKGSAANQIESAQPDAQVLAQATQAGLNPQEQQLLNQIQADTAKLKADEAAENAGTRRVNAQRTYIRGSLLRLAEAAWSLQQTSGHYHGHREEALKAMAKAHNQLMTCYGIDLQQ